MKTGNSILIKPSACLNCGKVCDGASAVGIEGEVRPSPDDITMCMYCGHLMAFDEQLSHRELTGAEIIEIAGDERVLAVSRSIAAFAEKRDK